MKIRKIKPLYFLNVVLVIVLLTSLLANASINRNGTAATKEYDPFKDLNIDGKINILDLVILAGYFGTSGTPINTTALLLELQAKIENMNNTIIELENNINYLNNTVVNLNETIIYLNETVVYLNSTVLDILPIGSMIAWAKSLTGVPSIPSNYIECNGQILNDPESPLNGQMIPNLNGFDGGTQRFLRGSTTSGSTGGTDISTFTLRTSDRMLISVGGFVTSGVEGLPGRGPTTNPASILPSYYEVVWIMRVK